MFDLVVLNGSRAGTRFELLELPAVLGRSPEAHLRIDDPWVSNMHALFEVRGAKLWVVDLDSRNGTFVGQERVGEALISAGLQLTFGRTEVRVEPRGAGAVHEEPPARTPARFDPTTLTARAVLPSSFTTGEHDLPGQARGGEAPPGTGRRKD